MELQTSKLGKVGITVEKDPWIITKSYDKLVIVRVEENSTTYISRKDVPSGIDFTNTEYWIPLGSSVNVQPEDTTKGVLNIVVEESTMYINKYSNFKIKFKIEGVNVKSTQAHADIYIDDIITASCIADINGDWIELADLSDTEKSIDKDIIIIKIRATDDEFNVAENYIICIKQNVALPTDHICYIIDQSNDVQNPKDKVSANFVKSSSGTLIKISENAVTSDSSTNFLKWLREHTHAYVGKYNDSKGLIYIKQLDDVQYGKFADGTDATDYLENWQEYAEDGEDYNVWIKFDIDVYYKTETYDENKVLVTIADKQLDDSVWEVFSKDTLIGAYKGSFYDMGYPVTGSVPHSTPTTLVIEDQINMIKNGMSFMAGYKFTSFKIHNFIALLFYGYYGTLDAQSICGYGNATYPRQTGNYDRPPMIDSTLISSNNNVSFWGLENWWGDIYEILEDTLYTITPDANIPFDIVYGNIVTIDNEDVIIYSAADLLEKYPSLLDYPILKTTYKGDIRFIVLPKDVEGCIKYMNFGKHGDLIPKDIDFDYSLNYTDKLQLDADINGYYLCRGGISNTPEGGVAALAAKHPSTTDGTLGFRIIYEGWDDIVIVDNFN